MNAVVVALHEDIPSGDLAALVAEKCLVDPDPDTILDWVNQAYFGGDLPGLPSDELGGDKRRKYTRVDIEQCLKTERCQQLIKEYRKARDEAHQELAGINEQERMDRERLAQERACETALVPHLEARVAALEALLRRRV